MDPADGVGQCESYPSEAATRDIAAKAWMKPNSFGAVNRQAVTENRNEAKHLREDAVQGIADAQKNLEKQLAEMAAVIDACVRFQQPYIDGILNEMCNAVKSRSPSNSLRKHEIRSPWPRPVRACFDFLRQII